MGAWKLSLAAVKNGFPGDTEANRPIHLKEAIDMTFEVGLQVLQIGKEFRVELCKLIHQLVGKAEDGTY